MSDETETHIECSNQYAVNSESTIVVLPLSGQRVHMLSPHSRENTPKTPAFYTTIAQAGHRIIRSDGSNEDKTELAVRFYLEQRELGNKISQRRVGEMFNVPRSTLNDHIKAHRKLYSFSMLE